MRGLLLAVTCLLSTLLIPLVIIHKLSNTPHQRHPVIRFTSSPPSTTSTSVLILCYNRPQYLDRTMRSLFSLPQAKHANIFISQDGNHQAVTDVITKWTNLKHNVKHLRFNYDEDKWGSSKNPNYVSGMYSNAYFKISAHYFFALDSVFSSDNTISEIIILEDDMELAIDFFPYFTNMRKLLEQDSSILCISAWNDNGQKDRVFDSSAFYRADVFPGLGWMIARKLWDELKPKWGVGYWDDWLRLESNSKGRSCIFPEVNRVYTFGEEGSSNGQFFKQYLANIKLNDMMIDWNSVEVEKYRKINYDKWLKNTLEASETIQTEELSRISKHLSNASQNKTYKISYTDERDFQRIADKFNLMPEFKEHKPRGSYKGVVPFRMGSTLVLVAPDILNI